MLGQSETVEAKCPLGLVDSERGSNSGVQHTISILVVGDSTSLEFRLTSTGAGLLYVTFAILVGIGGITILRRLWRQMGGLVYSMGQYKPVGV